jgi:tetratricopeptide (TPR) repeat protein
VIRQINISAGELFDLIRPAVLILSALLSIWVLASARKRFSFLIALLWAAATFSLTPIVLPLYLIVLLFRQGTPLSRRPRWRFVAPLVYGLVVISGIVFYLHNQNRGVDVHLARAAYAKIRGNRADAIAEYRSALQEEDDPHIRKLLGVELFELGRWTEALSELRRAEHGGEQDDLVILRIGSLLDALDQPHQARLEYQRFLLSPLCTQPVPDWRCETTRVLLEKKPE